jgi:hypothetical protein
MFTLTLVDRLFREPIVEDFNGLIADGLEPGKALREYSVLDLLKPGLVEGDEFLERRVALEDRNPRLAVASHNPDLGAA